MSLKVVGAGVGRTGTHSLKLALEKLLGNPCYHMVEVFEHPEDVSVWHAAAKGEAVDWHALMDGYAAAVDWPASAFWPELSKAFPEAVIVFSTREPESWWGSASETIFATIPTATENEKYAQWHAMVMDLLDRRFTKEISNREECLAAYDKHNRRVLENAPSERLLIWNASDGWEPLCKALNVPVPEEPFPRSNTKEEFLSRRSAVTADR